MNAQWLLALALSCPLAGGLVTWLARTQLNKRLGAINLTFTALSLICVALAWFGGGRQAITFQLPGFMALGLNFELNGLTAFFALLFLAAWTATSIYCFGYMENEGSQRRFYVFLQLTLLGCIGVVLASDLITLFLFFELMTLCSYVLVIHKEDAAAMSAGNLYLFLGVFGGLALLTGIFLLYNATGTASFTAIPPAVAENTGLVAAMGIAFLLGFGIKAGIFPLHIWLPKAHPVAPTPASALLSGIMIKTGAYGLFRVFYSVLAPAGKNGAAAVFFGSTLLGLGLITMVLGAFLALQQRQAKKTLAYSSVSQIGYIVMGLGTAVLPFGHDLYGVSGMLFHILNHAVFKTTLFLCVGAIYVYTHSLEFDQLGGLLKKYPLVTFAFVIGALGITGMPGFNGYGSKTFLHHALTDLYSANPSWLLWLAEKLFVLASALTICYFFKLFVNIFLGEKDWSRLPARMALSLQLPLVLGAAAVIYIGLFPQHTARAVIIPAMKAIGFDQISLEHVAGINVWNWHDLSSMAITIAVAAAILLLVYRFKIDNLKFPPWLSLERLLYLPAARGFMGLCQGPVAYADSLVNGIYHGFGGLFLGICKHSVRIDGAIDSLYRKAGTGSVKLIGATGLLDKRVNDLYSVLGKGSIKGFGKLAAWDRNLDELYKNLGLVYTRVIGKLDAVDRKLTETPVQPEDKREWLGRMQRAMATFSGKISNLNVEVLVAALALGVVALIFVFYGFLGGKMN
ncbi:MAG: complex I subunit 5 family protein [Eubacteriales bacterium]|nr:complex I subunit 5 family protein [Eubacteriales bacterium]